MPLFSRPQPEPNNPESLDAIKQGLLQRMPISELMTHVERIYASSSDVESFLETMNGMGKSALRLLTGRINTELPEQEKTHASRLLFMNAAYRSSGMRLAVTENISGLGSGNSQRDDVAEQVTAIKNALGERDLTQAISVLQAAENPSRVLRPLLASTRAYLLRALIEIPEAERNDKIKAVITDLGKWHGTHAHRERLSAWWRSRSIPTPTRELQYREPEPRPEPVPPPNLEQELIDALSRNRQDRASGYELSKIMQGMYDRYGRKVFFTAMDRLKPAARNLIHQRLLWMFSDRLSPAGRAFIMRYNEVKLRKGTTFVGAAKLAKMGRDMRRARAEQERAAAAEAATEEEPAPDLPPEAAPAQ